MASGITFAIHKEAITLVGGSTPTRALGTGFVFIRPEWVVTAKHVVQKDSGELRSDLAVLTETGWSTAECLFVHPDIDIAVLSVSGFCSHPLFPAHTRFAGSNGLITAGYKPSENEPGKPMSIEVNHVASFEIEVRSRSSSDEETICFPAEYAEGGHSGGPVFGAGGGVIGLVIQRASDGTRTFVRATSIAPLIAQLEFARDA